MGGRRGFGSGGRGEERWSDDDGGGDDDDDDDDDDCIVVNGDETLQINT